MEAMEGAGCFHLVEQMTTEQRAEVGKSLETSRECFGMASGDEVASGNLAASQRRETDELKASVRREADAEHCRTCDGTGRVIENFGPWQSNTGCWTCSGKGRVYRGTIQSYVRKATP